MAENVSRLMVGQLAEVTGRSGDTVTRLLRRAGLEPVARFGPAKFFVPRLALPIIYELDGRGLSLDAERARLAREQADATAMKNATRRSELLPQAEAQAAFVAMGAMLRQAVLELISRLPAALDGARTIVERQAIVHEHAHAVLNELAAFGDTLDRAADRKSK